LVPIFLNQPINN